MACTAASCQFIASKSASVQTVLGMCCPPASGAPPPSPFHFTALPSLVARSQAPSLLSPGSAAPLQLAPTAISVPWGAVANRPGCPATVTPQPGYQGGCDFT